MLFDVVEARHRTGRERVVFGDAPSRREGREFLKRLVRAHVSFREYAAVGISFEDLWRFDRFGHKDPRAAGFEKWHGKDDTVERLVAKFREAAAGITELQGLRVGPLRQIRLDEKWRPILDDKSEPVLGEEPGVLNRIYVPPWPPSLGRKLPAVADDLNALAAALETTAPLLRRHPHAPPKEREREFRLEWDRLARKRSHGPLDRLGTALFNAVFGTKEDQVNFKRRRKLDLGVKKVL